MKHETRQGFGTTTETKIAIRQTLPTTIEQGQFLEKNYEQVKQEINDELEKNLALEEKTVEQGGKNEDMGDSQKEKDVNYDPRKDYGDADDIPDYLKRQGSQRNVGDDDAWTPTVVDEESLYDHLMEQLNQLELSEKQLMIGEYVIGNIDGNGYLRATAYDIAYDILRKESIMASEDEVQAMIRIIQALDPTGIGASNLRECLMIQLKQKKGDRIADLAYTAVDRYLKDIADKHFDKLCKSLKIDSDTLTEVMKQIVKLDPRPGAGYVNDRVTQHAVVFTPEFSVKYNEETESVEIESINRLPQLQLSESYKTQGQVRLGAKSPKQAKDDQKLVRDDIKKASKLIDLLEIRQNTLLKIVRAIVEKQEKYFVTLDEADIQPLTLADIQPYVGCDLSVISRATKGKYIQTVEGSRPFRFFFSEGFVKNSADGAESEEVSTREILKALKNLIDSENKSKPMTDDALTQELNKLGYPIKRRTVAKYREEKLNIPVARQRKAQVAK